MTRDTSGGEIQTWSNLYTNVPASIQPISTKWSIIYQTRLIEVTHTIYFNKAINIANGNQITYGTRVFLVQGVRNPLEMSRQLVVDTLELS